jgi:hypothetical protein
MKTNGEVMCAHDGMHVFLIWWTQNKKRRSCCGSLVGRVLHDVQMHMFIMYCQLKNQTKNRDV